MRVTEEIAAILRPMPRPDEVEPEVYNEICQRIVEERKELASQLEAGWDAEGEDADPLLSAIADARGRRDEAEAQMRRLIGYGREFSRPRPYTLGDLAEAARMSISGIRTAYNDEDLAEVEEAIERRRHG